MGWFDEQIRQRKQSDNSVFRNSFVVIADAVMGTKYSSRLHEESVKNKSEIMRLLYYYRVQKQELPENITDVNEQLEFLMRPQGIMRRKVKLEGSWYKDSAGPLLGFRKDTGQAVALIPFGVSGYHFFDETKAKDVRVNKENASMFREDAYCFYRPLPLKKMNVSDFIRFIAGTISVSDFALLVILTLLIIVLGMFLPGLNYILFQDVTGSRNTRVLLAMMVLMICVCISRLLCNSVQYFVIARIKTKASVAVQAASMARVLSLPISFFKEYSSGELATRTQYINELCSMLVSTILTTGMTSLFSLLYISQVLAYAPSLVKPSLLIVVVTVLFSMISTAVQTRVSTRQMERSSEESGMTYAMISGIQKIKLAGAEKRAFARWADSYAKEADVAYNPTMFMKVNKVISLAISMAGIILIYYCAVKSEMSIANFFAFNTAYGMVFGAFKSMSDVVMTFARIRPTLEMAKPILEAVPEIAEGKQVLTRLTGNIELSNISFEYNHNAKILDKLSLKIRPGQYVAIVGAAGTGKTTLMRIMLGFETPDRGAVYVEGRDLNTVDLKSYRSRVGVVMQEGKLFQGDIMSNILISAPWLSEEDAWEAAEIAGIADDIRKMPMGMHTMISEGNGGISGGQRQRIMIARAIAHKPQILMFDEATSALDNLTQKKISDALEQMKCTRIVIAHRLSTIRNCPRIVVLKDGKIVEDGTYEELIANEGVFAGLLSKQQIEQ